MQAAHHPDANIPTRYHKETKDSGAFFPEYAPHRTTPHQNDGRHQWPSALVRLASSLLAFTSSSARLAALASRAGLAHAHAQHSHRVPAACASREAAHERGGLQRVPAPTAPSTPPAPCALLVGLAKGLDNKTIARDLAISVRTVETHRLSIRRKLKVDKPAGLVKYAMEHGLLLP